MVILLAIALGMLCVALLGICALYLKLKRKLKAQKFKDSDENVYHQAVYDANTEQVSILQRNDPITAVERQAIVHRLQRNIDREVENLGPDWGNDNVQELFAFGNSVV